MAILRKIRARLMQNRHVARIVNGAGTVLGLVWEGLRGLPPNFAAAGFYAFGAPLLTYLHFELERDIGITYLVENTFLTWWMVVGTFVVSGLWMSRDRSAPEHALGLIPMLVYALGVTLGITTGMLSVGGWLAVLYLMTGVVAMLIALRLSFDLKVEMARVDTQVEQITDLQVKIDKLEGRLEEALRDRRYEASVRGGDLEPVG